MWLGGMLLQLGSTGSAASSPASFMMTPMPALMVAEATQKPMQTNMSIGRLSLSLLTFAAATPWGAMLTTVSRGCGDLGRQRVIGSGTHTRGMRYRVVISVHLCSA